MYLKKSYLFGIEDVWEYNDVKIGCEVGRFLFILSLCIGFKEDKIEREIYFIKEVFEWVFENIIKFFVIRSVIDKRLIFFYRMSEKI